MEEERWCDKAGVNQWGMNAEQKMKVEAQLGDGSERL